MPSATTSGSFGARLVASNGSDVRLKRQTLAPAAAPSAVQRAVVLHDHLAEAKTDGRDAPCHVSESARPERPAQPSPKASSRRANSSSKADGPSAFAATRCWRTDAYFVDRPLLLAFAW